MAAGLFAVTCAFALAGLALIERAAARSRQRHRTELALHRRRAAQEADRADERVMDLVALAVDLEALLTSSTAAPAEHVAPATPSRCVTPARTVRRADGPPDAVRRDVFREVVGHPRAIGHLSYRSDPRAAWQPLYSTTPGGTPRPAVLVVTWGHC